MELAKGEKKKYGNSLFSRAFETKQKSSKNT
jgi:hypothetical protein